MKISIIGTGNLGTSIAKGLLGNDMFTSLYLTKKNISSLNEWQDISSVSVTNDNIKAVKNSDFIIISVQPNQFEKIANEIKSSITKRHTIISTITGLSINSIESLIGYEISIVRSMPNTAISVGKSVTCLCSNEIGIKQLKVAEAIFNNLGESFLIEEKDMQSATVLCASGIAFWMRLIRATAQGGVQLGFESKQALEISLNTALGAISLLKKNKSHPEEEIDKVTTPSGCTIKGLIEMENQGLSSALISGLEASYQKINNISNQKK